MGELTYSKLTFAKKGTSNQIIPLTIKSVDDFHHARVGDLLSCVVIHWCFPKILEMKE